MTDRRKKLFIPLCIISGFNLVFLAAAFITRGESILLEVCSNSVSDPAVFKHFFALASAAVKPDALINPEVSLTPFAVLLYAVVGRILPDAVTKAGSDELVHEFCKNHISMLTIVFISLVSLLLVLMLLEVFFKNNFSANEALFAGSVLTFSFPVLLCTEKGFATPLLLACILVFFIHKNSKKPLVREFSLIALSAASAAAVFPFIFALPLLTEGRKKELLRTAFYTLVLFFLPLFIMYFAGEYDESIFAVAWDMLSGGIKAVFGDEYFRHFQSGSPALANILNYYPVNEIDIGISRVLGYVISAACCAVLIFGFTKAQNITQKVFLLTAVILSIPVFSSKFTLPLLVIPFAFYLSEKKKNIPVLVLFSLLFVRFPFFSSRLANVFAQWLSRNLMGSEPSLMALVTPFIFAALCIVVLCEIFTNTKKSSV